MWSFGGDSSLGRRQRECLHRRCQRRRRYPCQYEAQLYFSFIFLIVCSFEELRLIIDDIHLSALSASLPLQIMISKQREQICASFIRPLFLSQFHGTMGSRLPGSCLLNISYLKIMEILILIWKQNAFLGLVQSPLFSVATAPSDGDNSQHCCKGCLGRNSISTAAAKVSPAVVNISNVSTIQGSHPVISIFTVY